jgi:hypothetical protein
MPTKGRTKPRNENLRSELGQMMLCFLPINMDIPGLPMEKELFDHARRFTVADLALGSGPAVFWYNHALPLSHTVKPVKHALCAFAAAHRSFLSRDRRRPFGTQHDLAIEHYNRAISQIQPLMSSPTPENIDAVLVCCVIFATLENMVGRHAESLRHLRAGWRLLESCQPGSSAAAPETLGGGGSSSCSSNAQLFHDVAGMLSRLHLDTSIYVADELVPTHGSFLAPSLDMGDPTVPFSSAADAEETLHDFDVVYTSFLDSTFFTCDSSPGTESGTPPREPSTPFAPAGITWATLDDMLLKWQARFNLFFTNLRNSGVASAAELRKATVLSLHSTVWGALIKLHGMNEDITPDDCRDILTIAESLAPALGGTEAKPNFSFAVEMVPAVTLVGLNCGDDVDLQQRTVKLLRSLHRRESVWDSQDMVEILEGIHLVKAKGILGHDQLPWGMAEMAGVLSQLSIPTVTSENGALGMLMAKIKQAKESGAG